MTTTPGFLLCISWHCHHTLPCSFTYFLTVDHFGFNGHSLSFQMCWSLGPCVSLNSFEIMQDGLHNNQSIKPYHTTHQNMYICWHLEHSGMPIAFSNCHQSFSFTLPVPYHSFLQEYLSHWYLTLISLYWRNILFGLDSKFNLNRCLYYKEWF